MHVLRWIWASMVMILLSGCVVVPQTQPDCRQALEMTDLVTEEENRIYRYSGYIVTPVAFPISAVMSGVYVLVNNQWLKMADPATVECLPDV